MLVFSELMERGRRDERIAAAIQPMKHRWRKILADLLTEGVRDGIYRPDLDPEAFATVMIASMIGFCRNPNKDADRFDRLVAELKRAIRNPALSADANLSNTAAASRHRSARPLKE